jgi:hypothetical protein
MRFIRRVRTPFRPLYSRPDLAKTILYSAANVRGVFVCNREELKTMVSALEAAGVHPVVDKVTSHWLMRTS